MANDDFYFSEIQATSFNKSITPAATSYSQLVNVSIPQDWFKHKFVVKFNYSSYDGYSQWSKIYYQIDWWDKVQAGNLSSSWTLQFTIYTLSTNNSLTIYYYNEKSYWYQFTISNSSIMRSTWLNKMPSSYIKSLPRELKAIANKIKATLFGYHTDWTRFTQ